MTADWATTADLATAGGTLVLALATFASVRSANRAARAAERATLDTLRPLLISSRPDAPSEKVGFQDGHWVQLRGASACVEATADTVYLAMSLRNVGRGLAVLDGWRSRHQEALLDPARPDARKFRRLTRDLFIPFGDTGFWQGTIRDTTDPDFAATAAAITHRTGLTIDLLYRDGEGGQRMITRFSVTPVADDSWLTAVTRHWNLDRTDPR